MLFSKDKKKLNYKNVIRMDTFSFFTESRDMQMKTGGSVGR
jgi:hypothetical protein